MKTKIFSQDWVMDPNPRDCDFTERSGQTAGILKLIKEYFDNCEAEKIKLYKKIVALLEENKTIIKPPAK